MRSEKFSRPNVLESRCSLSRFSLPSPSHSNCTWEIYLIDRLPNFSVNTAIMSLSASGKLSCDLFSTGSKRTLAIFVFFGAFLRELLHTFSQKFLVARSYQVLAE